MENNVEYLPSTRKLIYPHHENLIANSLVAYYTKDKYVDITFICKNNVCVQAHRVVIVSVCGLLKDIIQNSKEDMIYISVPDVESTIMDIFIHFLYEGVTRVSVRELKHFHDLIVSLGVTLSNCEVNSDVYNKHETSLEMLHELDKCYIDFPCANENNDIDIEGPCFGDQSPVLLSGTQSQDVDHLTAVEEKDVTEHSQCYEVDVEIETYFSTKHSPVANIFSNTPDMCLNNTGSPAVVQDFVSESTIIEKETDFVADEAQNCSMEYNFPLPNKENITFVNSIPNHVPSYKNEKSAMHQQRRSNTGVLASFSEEPCSVPTTHFESPNFGSTTDMERNGFSKDLKSRNISQEGIVNVYAEQTDPVKTSLKAVDMTFNNEEVPTVAQEYFNLDSSVSVSKESCSISHVHSESLNIGYTTDLEKKGVNKDMECRDMNEDGIVDIYDQILPVKTFPKAVEMSFGIKEAATVVPDHFDLSSSTLFTEDSCSLSATHSDPLNIGYIADMERKNFNTYIETKDISDERIVDVHAQQTSAIITFTKPVNVSSMNNEVPTADQDYFDLSSSASYSEDSCSLSTTHSDPLNIDYIADYNQDVESRAIHKEGIVDIHTEHTVPAKICPNAVDVSSINNEASSVLEVTPESKPSISALEPIASTATIATTNKITQRKQSARTNFMSAEEKYRVFRERNNIASKISRKKKADLKGTMLVEAEKLEKKKNALLHEIQKLELQKRKWQLVLKKFAKTCHIDYTDLSSSVSYTEDSSSVSTTQSDPLNIGYIADVEGKSSNQDVENSEEINEEKIVDTLTEQTVPVKPLQIAVDILSMISEASSVLQVTPEPEPSIFPLKSIASTATIATTSGSTQRRQNARNSFMSEEEKYRVYRERNNIASKVCRKRKATLQNTMLVEAEKLEKKKKALLQEIHNLEFKKRKWQLMLKALAKYQHKGNISKTVAKANIKYHIP